MVVIEEILLIRTHDPAVGLGGEEPALHGVRFAAAVERRDHQPLEFQGAGQLGGREEPRDRALAGELQPVLV
jgi:hypothetical protein